MNAFNILGLQEDADENQVRQRYHQLVKACHPDQFEGREEQQRAMMERQKEEERRREEEKKRKEDQRKEYKEAFSKWKEACRSVEEERDRRVAQWRTSRAEGLRKHATSVCEKAEKDIGDELAELEKKISDAETALSGLGLFKFSEKKTLDGGMYATPLIGHGDCEGMLFANIVRNGAAQAPGEFTAFSTKDGKVIYTTPLKQFVWTSPVAFYNEKNELFVVSGDSSGNIYLIRGRTGEILFTMPVAYNFESSPCVVGNALVVGSRTNGIYKMVVK